MIRKHAWGWDEPSKSPAVKSLAKLLHDIAGVTSILYGQVAYGGLELTLVPPVSICSRKQQTESQINVSYDTTPPAALGIALTPASQGLSPVHLLCMLKFTIIS